MNGVTLTERQRVKWRRWFEGWRWETDVQAAKTETLESPTWIYWSPATTFPTQEERMKAAAAGYRIETVSKNWWTVCWNDFSGGNLDKGGFSTARGSRQIKKCGKRIYGFSDHERI